MATNGVYSFHKRTQRQSLVQLDRICLLLFLLLLLQEYQYQEYQYFLLLLHHNLLGKQHMNRGQIPKW